MECQIEGKNKYRYCSELANAIESRWQAYWDEQQTYKTFGPGDEGFDKTKPKYYCLDMFPYPSGAGLHVGHPVGYIGSDIIARFKKMKGFNVLHPMGWDAFGLPAEQYAIETGVHPAKTTKKAIGTYREQLKKIGFSYDWSREFATIDSNYYMWTQWIWLQAYNSWFDTKTDKARPIIELIELIESDEQEFNIPDWANYSHKQKADFIDGYRLAYLGTQIVNWCPKLGTVLANEEVIDGKSERGEHPVIRMPLKQWMFRITAYADRLIEDLDELNWPDSTIRMQKEWIGKSEGADIDFNIIDRNMSIAVYTTRPDTIFGATFIVLAPEHPAVEAILSNPPEGCDRRILEEYVNAAKNRADVERMADSKEKNGVFTGLYATNPASKEAIPIWVADYVLMGYGHGAIMAVPAHDNRDNDFAKTHKINMRIVVQAKEKTSDDCYAGNGTVFNSTNNDISIDGLETEEAKDSIIKWLIETGKGTKKTNYRLRDWLFSRQRYWGEPFPVVFDEQGCHYPISPAALPVELPDLDNYTPIESNEPQPLLAKAKDWLNTTAGEAGVDPSILPPETVVRREANTMPGWAGSCWYELRFCSPHDNNRFVNKEAESYWMSNGVDLYIGGAEHAVLHLLYARFWHKLLFDLGHVSSKEPFNQLFHQGMLTSYAYYKSNKSLVMADRVEEKDGVFFDSETGEEVTQTVAKMSKSLRNVVNPDEVIDEYGADTLRLYEMYMGPLEASAPWNTRDIVGVHRFLQRVWRLGIDEESGVLRNDLAKESNHQIEQSLHNAIAKVSHDIPRLAYNTAIAAMIEFVNTATSHGPVTTNQLDLFIRILSPFAPHIAEEIHAALGNKGSITKQGWPHFDEAILEADTAEIPVQIMGKVRGKIQVSANATEDEIEQAALMDNHIASLIEGKEVRKIIVVQNKIVNIVVN